MFLNKALSRLKTLVDAHPSFISAYERIRAEFNEVQKPAHNNARDSILPHCECGKLMSLPPRTGTIDTWFFKCECGKTKPVA